MPKRVGYLYESVISVENCIAAEAEMTRHKTKNRTAMRIRANTEAYGETLSNLLASGSWEPEPYKEHMIYDGYRRKERKIKVPCLRDQAVHHAVMRVTVPYIRRRNYFYNCGSIDGAGQTRATKALQGWLKAKNPPKYAEQLDIRKFYDNCPHSAVMKALRRIFKDERFLALHEQILASMSDTGIGLAIGYYPSQWYANLVLQHVDVAVKQEYGKRLKLARYMDNFGLLCGRKRTLHKARLFINQLLERIGLALKRSWQVIRIAISGFSFLSYRFFYGYTLLNKKLMFRMARKIKQAARNLTAKTAAAVMSYKGILKPCNSYNFRTKYLYPIISIKKCKEVIRNETKNRVRRVSCAV
ncbi:MAG: RNA-directed DNA polymerase [Eubacteriales bacterium]|nr:RNA-directed DNA polymerase [Eubacteriales bacterium]